MTQKLEFWIREFVEIEEYIPASLAANLLYDEWVQLTSPERWISNRGYIHKSVRRSKDRSIWFRKIKQEIPLRFATKEEIIAWHCRELGIQHLSSELDGNMDIEAILKGKEIILRVIDE